MDRFDDDEDAAEFEPESVALDIFAQYAGGASIPPGARQPVG